MADETVLVITDCEEIFLLYKAILSREGFTVLKAEDNDFGFRVALERKPTLILMDQPEFDRGGREVLEKLKEQQLPTRAIIYTIPPVSTSRLVEFIQAGICDYITHPVSPDELVDTVKRTLALDTNSTVHTPIVEKMLAIIDRQGQAYLELRERYQWYLKNLNRHACDCQELIERRRYQEPKSTALRKLGTVDDGYYRGDHFVCDVCGTHWVMWWTEGFSWKPVDSKQ